MKTIVSFIIAVLFVHFSFGQSPTILDTEEKMKPTLWLDICDFNNSNIFKLDTIGFGDIPKEIEYRGIIVELVKWTDSSGTNILLLSQTGAFKFRDTLGDLYDKAEINAYLFTKKKMSKTFLRQWKIYDYVDCFGVDMYAGFYKRSLTITDLDKDGIAEITFLYKLSCRGGADPATQKLIMYEGADKYALRGETTICAEDSKENYGGKYSADEKLKKQISFYEYAKKRWSMIGCDDWKQFIQ